LRVSHLQNIEFQTGFSPQKKRIHQFYDPDKSFLRPGISQNISPNVLSSYSSIHPDFGLGKVKKNLPFALPDEIDVLEALLATCLLQADSPAHFRMHHTSRRENLIISSKTKT
jgi:hypothetical protein